jgi:hypothetical protein
MRVSCKASLLSFNTTFTPWSAREGLDGKFSTTYYLCYRLGYPLAPPRWQHTPFDDIGSLGIDLHVETSNNIFIASWSLGLKHLCPTWLSLF